jgi:ketosteroid isomerase-like protein
MTESTDLLRVMFDAFNRRDFDVALSGMDPEVELHPALTELDVRDCYRGRDEVRVFFETITDAWDQYVVEPLEMTETPDGRVLAVERWRARGRQGIEFDFELVDVYTFGGGLIARIEGFRDKAQALDATLV